MNFLEWLQENIFTIITSGGVLAFIGYVYHKFIKSVVPNLIKSVTNVAARLISNLFGTNYDDGNDMVDKLPLVDKLKELEEDIRLNNELKLLEYKQKLASPLYDELEKIPIQKAYDQIFAIMEGKISEEILEALQAIDNIKK